MGDAYVSFEAGYNRTMKIAGVLGEIGNVAFSPFRLLRSHLDVKKTTGALDEAGSYYNTALGEAVRNTGAKGGATADSVAQQARKAYKANPDAAPEELIDPASYLETYGNNPYGRRQAQRAVEVGQATHADQLARTKRLKDVGRVGALGASGAGGYYAYNKGRESSLQGKQPFYR